MTRLRGGALRALATLALAAALIGSEGCPTGSPVNQAPTLGGVSVPSPALVGDPVTASGEISDADGQVKLRVEWGDGTSDESELGAARTQAFSHVLTSAGTFTVTLTAIDDAGQASSAQTASITVTNSLPTLGTLSVSRGRTAGETFGVITQIADRENRVKLRVDWGDGVVDETELGNSRTLTITHVFTASGTFAVTFTAIDDVGQASEPQTVQVTIPPADDPNVNQPPTLGAVAVDPAAQVGQIVTASAELLDAENQVKLHVDWGDGNSDESGLGLSRTQSLTHQYGAAGTFTVTFTAVDDDGQTSAPSTAQTTIAPFSGNNQPPTLGTVSVTPQADFGQSVTATADLVDTENEVKLRINWGDGATQDSPLGASRTQSLTHLYAKDGTFTVTFTAVDGADQASASKTAETTILPTDQITSTANSITTSDGGVRNDPEGIAAPAAVTRITWRDSRDAPRTLVLGPYLYQYDFTFDDNTQVVARSANDDAYGHPGFGYVVSHNNQNGNSPLGKLNVPSSVTTTVFTGAHHAIHRVELLYDRDKELDGKGIKIPVIIEWLVATGRDHPVWAVTWRTGQAVNPNNADFDVYRMDVRGPYGSLNFDGAADKNSGDAIGGVAWGDFGLRFTTTDAELTLNSPWTYNTPNTVNFTHTWTKTTNAEMGIVQTRPLDKEMGYPDRVVGHERGSTSADNYPDKGNCNAFGDNRNYVMPCINGWPYQLMNYDWSGAKLPEDATGTKLIAWGSPYGWLGASSFKVFDGSAADGRGDRSYATFIVLGPRCRFTNGVCDQPGDVALTINEVEALAAADISNIGPGFLVDELPKGPGAEQVKTVNEGYNDTYAAYYVHANINQARFTFTPAAGLPVPNPVFVVQNYTTTARPKITVDGNAVSVNSGAADSGAFVSLNTATDELWVTLNRTVTAATEIDIVP